MTHFFVEVILPIPVEKTFTYAVNEAEYHFIKPGSRVAVPFGKNKVYTALALKTHQQKPLLYEAKDIYQIIDNEPIVNKFQLEFWQWIANYYMCSLGEVFKAALPSMYLLESETIIFKQKNEVEEHLLTDDEFLVLEALEHQSQLTLEQISKIVDKKKVMPIINALLSKKIISTKEEFFEIYKPKLEKYVRLHSNYQKDDDLKLLFNSLERAQKQKEALLAFFQLSSLKKNIKVKELEKKSSSSKAVINSLVAKNILEIYTKQVDRIILPKQIKSLLALSHHQQEALEHTLHQFKNHDVCLLHGITSSGKTEVYAHLIKQQLEQKKQVLFLVPEIALTTQIIQRLQKYFGDQMVVFHSKYSLSERVESYQKIINNQNKGQLIVGVRSAIFLPYSNLGLILVDEEHEVTYKQMEPSPKYHARDAAIVLANLHQAKVLLGSATPSLETFFNVQQKKYGFVALTERFGNVNAPTITVIDCKEKQRKKRMKGLFSDDLLAEIHTSLSNKEQVILFQNRRGFSPIIECNSCGVSPQCPNCDVSLTHHKYKNELRCHYCNYTRAMPQHCDACGSNQLENVGFGTEQIEIALKEHFKDAKISRMDFDTTRGKNSYQNIINDFENAAIDILVGTQMLSKGLDFENVSLVGILQADTLLNFPDFRAHERAFQMMLQVAGRAGRSKKQGNVLIQTLQPTHTIIQQVVAADYKAMYTNQLVERQAFNYPPYYRLIKFTFKHKNYAIADSAVNWFVKALQNSFGTNVLGPSTPSVSRVRNQYIKNITLKIPPKQSLTKTKAQILKIKSTFEAVKEFRSVRLLIDVDAY